MNIKKSFSTFTSRVVPHSRTAAILLLIILKMEHKKPDYYINIIISLYDSDIIQVSAIPLHYSTLNLAHYMSAIKVTNQFRHV